MTEIDAIYVCEICGNTVEILGTGNGTLVCCGQPMTLQKPNTVDASREKHVPVAVREGNLVKVRVGAVDHPMTEQHYIQWVELEQNGLTQRIMLRPGDEPAVEFFVGDGEFRVRAYCNLHGLWVLI